MGGGEGSSAREALKHKSMEKVVMCDIDKVRLLQIFITHIFLAVPQIEKLIISIFILEIFNNKKTKSLCFPKIKRDNFVKIYKQGHSTI